MERFANLNLEDINNIVLKMYYKTYIRQAKMEHRNY